MPDLSQIYSKFSQMADSKMAVLADWRLVFGHPILTNGGQFLADWRIFAKIFDILGKIGNYQLFFVEIELLI